MNMTESKQRPDSFDQSTAHTPGPWYAHFVTAVGEESEDGDYNDATGITTNSEEEFQREGARGDLIAFVPHDRNHEANARLIAAAPELLAALESIERTLSDHPDREKGNTRVHYVFHTARAAIAKARGE